VAIKVVRSQGELGLRDADPKGGCAYIDVLNSILSEIDILEVRGACIHAGLQTCATLPSSPKHHVTAENLCFPTQAMGSHPNIVELLGQDRVDHVMVMEQASSDLYTVIKKMGSDQGVPEHMIRSWAQCICAGVSHVHACGYVHQDLKSSNVLVFGDRSVTFRLRAGNLALVFRV
jgi:serine/threonine protein kinase